MEKKIEFDSKEILGHGSYGTEVYQGKCEGTPVAVKIIPMLGAAKKRFHTEYTVFSENINSEYIVKCLGVDLSSDMYMFLALELCDSSLMHYNITHLDCDCKIDICYQVTSGVKYLHSRHIVHGDLTPSNVLIKRNENQIHIKVADFGMSKILPERGRGLLRASSGICTTEWMAPELIKEVQIGRKRRQKDLVLNTTFATDVFSLGCLKYFIITGGLHLFGEIFSREVNILHNLPKFQMECLESGLVSIACMIFYETLPSPYNRPSSADILSSPVLWEKRKDEEFLKAVKKHILPSNECTQKLTKAVQLMTRYLDYQEKPENIRESETLRKELCGMKFVIQLISLKLGLNAALIPETSKSFWLEKHFKIWKYLIFEAFHPWSEKKGLKNFYTSWKFEKDIIDILQMCSKESFDYSPTSNTQEITDGISTLNLQMERSIASLHKIARLGSYEEFTKLWEKIRSNYKITDSDVFEILTCSIKYSYADNDGIIRQKIGIIDMLCSAFEDLLFFTNENNQTVLHLPNINVDIIIHLIKLGASVSAVDTEGNTVMHIAPHYLTSKEYHKLVSVVLQRRLDVVFSILSNLGKSPIKIATECFDILPETHKILKDRKLIQGEPSQMSVDYKLSSGPSRTSASKVSDKIKPIRTKEKGQRKGTQEVTKMEKGPAHNMEKWQQAYIIGNLNDLISYIEFNAALKSKLLAYGVLSKTDVELLDAESYMRGKSSASLKFYDILKTKLGAYGVLIKALEETNQTGAAQILKHGMRVFEIQK